METIFCQLQFVRLIHFLAGQLAMLCSFSCQTLSDLFSLFTDNVKWQSEFVSSLSSLHFIPIKLYQLYLIYEFKELARLGPIKTVFSCEDAAQQVLMSSVCPSVCLSVSKLKFYLVTALRMFQSVPECSRMHAECYRMLQNVTECYRMFQNACSYISLHPVT